MRDKSGRFTKAPKRTKESDLADIYWTVQELKRDFGSLIYVVSDLRGELNERLRVIELKLEQLQNPPTLTGWSKAEREAFLTGLRSV